MILATLYLRNNIYIIGQIFPESTRSAENKYTDDMSNARSSKKSDRIKQTKKTGIVFHFKFIHF